MATYLSLTNELLRRLNEVEIEQVDFGSVRNIQSLAKDSINNSVRHVLQIAQEWPFTLTTYTQTLTSGVNQYDYPSDMSTVDLDSFYLKKHSVILNQPKKLPILEYSEYLRHYRPLDDNGESGSPEHVFQTNDTAFGVSPTPDGAYEVEYQYYSFPQDMSTATEVCVIPDRFNHVVITGAMMYMMRFRSNEQSAQAHKQEFEEQIRHMRRILLDEPVAVTSTVTLR